VDLLELGSSESPRRLSYGPGIWTQCV